MTIARRGCRCDGMAYQISDAVFEHLDFREKNGYRRHRTTILLDGGTEVEGTVYLAAPGNFAYLGPASAEAIAAHIAGSHGPSGSNRDYLLALAHALRELGIHDEHVFELEALL